MQGPKGSGRSVAAASLPSSKRKSQNKFDERRQQRVRGAGKHAIIERQYQFFDPSSSTSMSISSSPSSSSTLLVTPSSPSAFGAGNTSRGSMIMGPPPALDTPIMRRGRGAAAPGSEMGSATSIRSGRAFDPSMMMPGSGGVNSSSPTSKNIDPRLRGYFGANNDDEGSTTRYAALVDANAHTSSSPMVNGRLLVGKTIEERRQERRRGAATHQIEQRPIRFSLGSLSGVSEQDGPSSDYDYGKEDNSGVVGSGEIQWKSPAGSLDRFMDEVDTRREMQQRQQKDGGNSSIINSSPLAPPSKGPGSKSSWIEERRAMRRRGAGTHPIEKRLITFAPRASDQASAAASSSFLHSDDDDGSSSLFAGAGEGQDRRDTNDEGDFDFEMGGGGLDDGYADEMDEQHPATPTSYAAPADADKGRKRRRESPIRNVRRKGPQKKGSAKNGDGQRRPIDIAAIDDEADQTIVGQADETLREQREEVAPTSLPAWTFAKMDHNITNRDLMEMKKQTREMVTLALGNEAGAIRSVKVNDADVLYSIVKREMQRARQQASGPIQDFLDELDGSVLQTFTRLSSQSAERAQLINHLVMARRKNIHLQKEVFKKRSKVLDVLRIMKILKEQEIRRVQQEENEEKSLTFLRQLQTVARQWC